MIINSSTEQPVNEDQLMGIVRKFKRFCRFGRFISPQIFPTMTMNQLLATILFFKNKLVQKQSSCYCQNGNNEKSFCNVKRERANFLQY